MNTENPSLLLIHREAEQQEQWTLAFESAGFAVATAATMVQAQTLLEGGRVIDAVVAQWESAATIGGDVYRWALKHRFDLRSQFVFVAEDPPSGFDAVVAGRCILVSPTQGDDVIAAVAAAAGRSPRFRNPGPAPGKSTGPTLLLADDDPVLLDTMMRLLAAEGFSVTAVESGNAALAALGREEFDLIVCDWQMDQGSGADVVNHLAQHAPNLLERVVLLANVVTAEMNTAARGRPIFAKGQDATGLLRLLNTLALDEWS